MASRGVLTHALMLHIQGILRGHESPQQQQEPQDPDDSNDSPLTDSPCDEAEDENDGDEYVDDGDGDGYGDGDGDGEEECEEYAGPPLFDDDNEEQGENDDDGERHDGEEVEDVVFDTTPDHAPSVFGSDMDAVLEWATSSAGPWPR